MEKEVTSNQFEQIKKTSEKEVYNFPLNDKVYLNGNNYTVVKCFVADNAEFRTLRTAGNDEIYMLSSLQKDAELDNDFKVLPKE